MICSLKLKAICLFNNNSIYIRESIRPKYGYYPNNSSNKITILNKDHDNSVFQGTCYLNKQLSKIVLLKVPINSFT